MMTTHEIDYYVIRRLDNGQYATPPGSEHSYARRLEHTEWYLGYDHAKRQCGELEQPVRLASLWKHGVRA